MKLVLFENPGDSEPRPGLLTGRGIVDISGHVAQSYTPQLTMQGIIDDFERLRPALEAAVANGDAKPADSVRLRPPLPRPGKILCCIGNYWEHAQREPRPLNMFMKNPEAVIGPDDTIILPKLTEPWIFMHEAELALVIKSRQLARQILRDLRADRAVHHDGRRDPRPQQRRRALLGRRAVAPQLQYRRHGASGARTRRVRLVDHDPEFG